WHGDAKAVKVHDLVTLMGGEAPVVSRIEARSGRSLGDIAIRLSGDIVADLGHGIELRSGEIIGLAGLEGSGQKELLHQIFSPSQKGSARVERKGRAAFVSGDRQREGVFPLWTVLGNIALGRIVQRMPLGLISDKAERLAMRTSTDRLQ